MKKTIGFVVLGVALLFNGCASSSKRSNDVNNNENMPFIER
jgi:PBP1b-binding outer membrane lipoprotein LpoB